MAPDAYTQAPKVPPHLLEVWAGFQLLHDSRRIGMDVSAIAPTDVVAWLDLIAVRDPLLREDYFAIVRQLDSYWLSKHRSDGDTQSSD